MSNTLTPLTSLANFDDFGTSSGTSSIDDEAAAFENPTPNYSDNQLDNLINIPSDVDESNLTIPNVAAPAVPTTGTNTAATTVPPTATQNATSVVSSIWGIITGNIENGIFVVLGLLLIAAGIFAFKSTQTVVKLAGKAGATAAEVAA